MKLAGGQRYSTVAAGRLRRARAAGTAGAARRVGGGRPRHRRAAVRDSRRHRERARPAARRVQPRAARLRRPRGPGEDRPARRSAAGSRRSSSSRCRRRTLDALVASLRQDFTNAFARVRSYKATEDDIGENFARAENYLSLVGLVIVILGGIGVSSVTRVFVQQKMKASPSSSAWARGRRQLLAVYVAQVMVLGLAGSVLGVVLALGAIAAIPATLAAAATPGRGHPLRPDRAGGDAGRSASACWCRCCSRWCRCSRCGT